MSVEHVRIAGVVVAALFAGYGILRYRRGGWSRFDLLLAVLIAAGVTLISLLPQVGEIFVRLFGLENRAFALLSFSTLLLFGLFLYLLGRVREASRRSGEIVTGLAVNQYAEKYLDRSPREAELGEGNREVLIIIPAYDEEGVFRMVLRKVPKNLLGYMLKKVVVDEGSCEATSA